MSARIHFHSDVEFFAGCENMLVNFFNDKDFIENYEVSFSYRYSLEYEQGLRARVKNDIKTYPLAILDSGWLSVLGNKLSFKPFAVVVKLLAQFWKCVCIAYNTILLLILFKKLKIDLLHINNGGYPGAYSCMSAVFAARLAGIKRIVYVVNNVAVPYDRPARWIDYGFDQWVVEIVTVFVTGSKYAAGKLKGVLHLPQGKIKNIHNGILLRPVAENKAMFCERLGLHQDRPLIGVVAVLEERKGHIYLLKAIKMLKEKGWHDQKPPYVIIEGQGSLLESLKRYVSDEQLEDYVRFIGTEKNIPNLMNAIDVLVLPSISNEDFPNVILEAMGFGKAVIASEICGVPEQIEHNKSGILVEPSDVQALVQAIDLLMKDPSLLKVFGDRAKQIFNEKFLASRSVSNYRELYNGLLAGGA